MVGGGPGRLSCRCMITGVEQSRWDRVTCVPHGWASVLVEVGAWGLEALGTAEFGEEHSHGLPTFNNKVEGETQWEKP